MSGKFISLEGIDGSGKSLQADLLYKYLIIRQKNILSVREPGGTFIGEQIRNILMNKNNIDMNDITEALLFMAARAQIVKEKILPALEKKHIVICDRFIDSSLVYQSYARGTDKKLICELNYLVTNGIKPDITFLLDIKPQEVIVRKNIIKEIKQEDRIELEEFSFHERVYDGYKNIARENQDRIVIINANREPEIIHEEIISILKAKKYV